ncbi:MAG: glycoside hydrolase family 2 TIM barrel-domain containing protein, partial [Gammaproteobacteria bacterium]
LGCNMLRKHVKVEPARLYYWCDKLGLMVWQDMPNGDKHVGRKGPDIKRSDESAGQFELELKRLIDAFGNHPCIVMWVPFNEGWGQYDTARIADLVKKRDPTRLVNQASGWADRGVGDVHDIHKYPGPAAPPTEEKRAAVLGEFGGLGLPVKGHTWQDEKNWGYRSYKTREELTDAYLALIDNLRSLIGGGLCAGVYTQTTDVQIEVNGLMTYDRAMIKMDVEKTAAANKRLYLPPPVVKTIVPTSQKWGQSWRYTTSKPADGWQQGDYGDSDWEEGKGGFGTKGTPGAVVRTEWDTSGIWLRRTFELESTKLNRPRLLIHHDEDAEVYINGLLVAKLEGYASSYVQVRLDEKAKKALKVGSNCLAVHCRQSTGGQYIDVGLVDVKEQSDK